MNLHIISQSPFAHQSPFNALKALNTGDKVVLINDGSYCLKHDIYMEKLLAVPVSVFILDNDCDMRGINANQPDIKAINMDSLVNFSFDATHILSWN